MISVIVPVYNVETYIKECLDSILNQTYKDFELILVNDGSTDRSLDILLEYAKIDKRIKVLVKKNGGQSSARNLGLDNAEGEFIAFIDSDDVVSIDYLEVLYKALCDTNTKMVQSKIERFFDVPKFNNFVGFVEVVEFSKCYDNLKYIKCYNDSVSCKLFHKSLFEDLRFIEGEIFEDGKIIIELLLKSVKQTNVDYCGYFYRYTPNSTITSLNPKKDYEQVVVWENRKQIYIYLNYKNHIKEIDSRIIKILLRQYYNAKVNSADVDIIHKLKVKIKEYLPTIKNNQFLIGWKDKMLIKLCKISPNFYVCFYKFNNKLKGRL